ncbi:MAG: PAS domain S-box protein, partial [Ramlibacter sp.]|nr:PAS domain S-box protein [Ramlibacter sp.]
RRARRPENKATAMRMQIRPTRAIGLLATLTITLITVSVAFMLWDMRKRELEAARLDTVAFAHMIREETEHSFDRIDLVLRGVQERMQTAYGGSLELDSVSVRLLMSARIFGVRQLGVLFLLDARGNIVNSSREGEILGASHADQEYYKAFIGGQSEGLYIGRPVREPTQGGAWMVHIARSFTGTDGKFRGVAVAKMDLFRMEQVYQAMRADHPRPMSLYLADGTLLASVPHRENLIGEYAPELGSGPLPGPGSEVRMVDHATGDGGRQAFALARTGRFPLLVGVPNDEELALATWRENAMVVVFGAVLVCAFVVTAAGLLVRAVNRQAELARALRDANDRYHRTIDSVMDAIIAVDASHDILLFNPAAERMFGLAKSEMLGQPLTRLIPERAREAHALHMDRFMCTNGESRAMASKMEITGLRADGTEFPIESTISQTLIEGKPQLTAVLRDITQRRRAEEDLREMNRQLRSLSASLQDVREQERTRIAMELHDDLGQQLTGLKLELSWLGGRLKEGRQAMPEEVGAMRQMLDTAIASVRRIASELRPVILDDLGFGEAVAWQTAEFAKRSGLDIELDLQAQDLVKDDVLATALFRIVQESLTNVVRHAGANRVQVRLARDEDRLVLTVVDDGSGISGGPRTGGGIGLVSMRERATALGGQLNIASVPGAGTTIEVTLPLGRAALEKETA